MNYKAAIDRVYTHLENGHVDKAVMGCSRIAMNLKDYLYYFVFLREMNPSKTEIDYAISNEMGHLNEESIKFLNEKSFSYWSNNHKLDFSLSPDIEDDKNYLIVSIGEIDPELEQWEKTIGDLSVPPGMGEYDTAAFTDRYDQQKAMFRLRIKALLVIKNRLRTLAWNYVSRVEKQIESQEKPQEFIDQIFNDVNNYFKARSEDVYIKLQKASQLIDSGDLEDQSLLLAQVRRAIKASADYFYPASDKPVICSDGKERILGDEQYLNRFQEYLRICFTKSSSRDLLCAEMDYLSAFSRRLNEVASKGVHADVSHRDAKQGLLGLYMFLYNVVSQLQEKTAW